MTTRIFAMRSPLSQRICQLAIQGTLGMSGYHHLYVRCVDMAILTAHLNPATIVVENYDPGHNFLVYITHVWLYNQLT